MEQVKNQHSQKEALFYEQLGDHRVRCLLCPHRCVIKPGNRGVCRVRMNEEGRLISENYGKISALHKDPIEKKPLYHFYPGRSIVSIGSIGCNLGCEFCQNWQISQSCMDDYPRLHFSTPEDIAELAVKEKDNIGVAYTYNEPLVFYEFMKDTCLLVHESGKKNVAVTNGFIETEPLKEMLTFTDAFNIDLKAFDNSFYRKYTHSSLEPVLQNLVSIAASGRHLEITYLIIPELNDDMDRFRKMIDWMSAELGREVVLHLSRYFPQYRMDSPPTPEATMTTFFNIAREKLDYVYLGNMGSSGQGHHTPCPVCGSILIERSGYRTQLTGMDEQAACKQCGGKIPVIL